MTFWSRKLWILGGLCVALGGCAAAKKQTVPVQRYSLGLARADYRDYAGARANICDAEPRWLTDELSAVNGLMARFLSSTEQALDPEAVEHDQHLETLKQANETLGPVLDVHAANLRSMKACGFATKGAFPELSRRGNELLERARTRLAEAPQAIAASELKEKQRLWVEEAPLREQTARQTWCAKRPEVGNTDLYFARQYTNGRTEWLFCDGHVVEVAATGGEPVLISPSGLSWRERRRVKPPRYLEAARNYPLEEIERMPGTELRTSWLKPQTTGGSSGTGQ
ncbi:MAG TPA: hypothetical protein VLQ93_15565 [Myxococcaceae bacterium]|nr:hypothetical protein [Myxococcaceae bacterium]